VMNGQVERGEREAPSLSGLPLSTSGVAAKLERGLGGEVPILRMKGRLRLHFALPMQRISQ
jgi:hypothetical protein